MYSSTSHRCFKYSIFSVFLLQHSVIAHLFFKLYLCDMVYVRQDIFLLALLVLTAEIHLWKGLNIFYSSRTWQDLSIKILNLTFTWEGKLSLDGKCFNQWCYTNNSTFNLLNASSFLNVCTNLTWILVCRDPDASQAIQCPVRWELTPCNESVSYGPGQRYDAV